jgi:tyrosyl-tRNA synthetase
VLAEEVTRLVRGEQGLHTALKATRVMFGDEPVDSLPPSGPPARAPFLSGDLLILRGAWCVVRGACAVVVVFTHNYAELLAVLKDVPSVTLPRSSVVGQPLSGLMVACRATASKGEARRLVKGGGVYVNSKRVPNDDYQVGPDDVLGDALCVLRVGKKSYFLVKLTPQ